MSVDQTQRIPATARRGGYVIAAVINAVLLYLINVSPGWQVLPFLTEDTRDVLGLVNLSLAVGLAANVTYVAYDAPLWKALGDLVTATIGLAAAVRLLQVFPLDFTGSSFDWTVPVRVLLIIAVVGGSIAVIVQVVQVVRGLVRLIRDRPTQA